MENHCYLVVLTGFWFFSTLQHICPRLGSSGCSTHFSGFTDQLGHSLVWLWPTTAWLTMDFFQQFDDSTLDMFFKNLVHLGPHLGSYSYSSTFSGVKYQMSNPLVGFWPNTTWLLKPLILAMKYDILFLGTTNLKFCFWVFLSTYLNPPNFSDMIRLFTRALVLGWPKTAWWPNFIDFPSKRGAILNCLPRFLFCSRPGRRIFGQCSRASFSAVCGPISPRFRAWGVPCSSASLWTTFLGLCVLFGHEFFGLRRVVCTPRFFGLAATLAFPAAWMLALRPRMGYEVGIMDTLTLSLNIQEIKAAHEAGEYHGQEDVKAAIRAVATEEVLADPNLCKFDWLRVCAKLLGRAGSGSGRSAEVLRRELCQDLYGVVPAGPPPLAPPYLPLVAVTPLGNGDLSALVRATQPGAAQPVASTGALATGGMAAQTLPASPPATTAAAVTAAGAAPADPSRLMRVLPGGAAPPVVHTSPHTSPGHWAAAPYAASAAATPGVAAPESAATAAAGVTAPVNPQLFPLGDVTVSGTPTSYSSRRCMSAASALPLHSGHRRRASLRSPPPHRQRPRSPTGRLRPRLPPGRRSAPLRRHPVPRRSTSTSTKTAWKSCFGRSSVNSCSYSDGRTSNWPRSCTKTSCSCSSCHCAPRLRNKSTWRATSRRSRLPLPSPQEWPHRITPRPFCGLSGRVLRQGVRQPQRPRIMAGRPRTRERRLPPARYWETIGAPR